MKPQAKAKIFLSDHRGLCETDRMRSYNTFNYGECFNGHKTAFGDLYLLNDDTIAAGHSVTMDAGEHSQVLLLPLVGTLVYKVNHEKEAIIDPGQLTILYLQKGAALTLMNCYGSELINFIQFWIKAGAAGLNLNSLLYTFDPDKYRDRLIPIEADAGEASLRVSLGKFGGRREAIYKCRSASGNVFAFVIQGVFELQGMLVHARDGLGFTGCLHDLELEALSNDAIIFILEMGSF